MDFRELFTLQLEMFALMGMGAVLRKKNVLTHEGKNVLTDLVIDIVLPCSIINSFCIELDSNMIASCAQVLMISVGIQVLCSFLAGILYRHVPRERRVILQYGTIVSNAGFLGNAVAEGLYGAAGLLYASFYIIPQRIVMWSEGVSYFTESPNKTDVLKKVLRHPCVVAAEIGTALMVTQFHLPAFLSKSIAAAGGCTTPLTMFMIGAVLAEADMHHIVSRETLYYSFIRLIFIPAVVMACCVVFRVEALAADISVVLAAMPAGATTAILASKYNADEAFASKCIVLTTVLSMVLLPVWCTVLEKIF